MAIGRCALMALLAVFSLSASAAKVCSLQQNADSVAACQAEGLLADNFEAHPSMTNSSDISLESCASACADLHPESQLKIAAVSATTCYCVAPALASLPSAFALNDTQCNTPCPGDAAEQCGGSGAPSAVSVSAYSCRAAVATCAQPSAKLPDVGDLCAMQANGAAVYRGEFVQSVVNGSFVGVARFGFNLCPGSSATLHARADERTGNLVSELRVFQTRTATVVVSYPNTTSPARLQYENTGATPLWVMLLATTTGDDIASDASVEVALDIQGATDCTPEDFATTTAPATEATTTTTTTLTTTTSTTTTTGTIEGCPVAGDNLQCQFIEEVCGKTVAEIIEIADSDPDLEHDPVLINCISGLCCACQGENKDRPECKDGASLANIVKIGDDFPLHKLIEKNLDNANIDEVCSLAAIVLPIYKEKLAPCNGDVPAYTEAPPKTTIDYGSCDGRNYTRHDISKCYAVQVTCSFTSIALETRAEAPVWNEDPGFLKCLDQMACACNYTSDGLCAYPTVADVFPPFADPAFGAGLEMYTFGNLTAYVQDQLRALGQDVMPACINTETTSTTTTTSEVTTTSTTTKYPPCPEDDPIQCNFFKDTCGHPAEYYVDRVIKSKWTDPEFMVCVTQMCCACDEGRSKKKECKYGEDLSSLIPIDPDYPGYAAVKLLLKDVTFDAACRLAPILLKGPDFEREDCPVESTTTRATTTTATTTTKKTTTTAKPAGSTNDSKDDNGNTTIIIAVAVCGTVVILAAIIAIVMTRKKNQKYSTGAGALEFSNPSFGGDPENSMISFDEPLDFASEA